uniref:Uncharacterized protein n=1 Tax=Anguilla anguilla TaxID=7936 RepID=A0A0E9Q046_ANGAN
MQYWSSYSTSLPGLALGRPSLGCLRLRALC